jgi:hypothetical protein
LEELQKAHTGKEKSVEGRVIGRTRAKSQEEIYLSMTTSPYW